MEYRDQLKYIKSHGNGDGRRKRKKKKRQRDVLPSGSGAAGRILCMLQSVSSVALFGAMAILGILPAAYMAGLAVLLLLLFITVKWLQRSALRGRRRKGAGNGLSLVLSALFILFGFYAIKVNGALDKIATGEESGN